MAYSTLEDLKTYMPNNHLVQLTDDENVNEIDTEVVDDAIARADNLIDSYLRGRYPVPIADSEDVPQEIKDISTKVAAYNLYRKNMQLTLPEPVKIEYKQAIDLLKMIQSGKVSPFAANEEPTVIRTNKTSSDKIYSSTKWDTY